MGSEFDLYLGIGSILCGIYCFYAVYSMKTTGKICTTLLLDKETAKKPCKNIGEYLVSVMPPVIVLGIVLIACGAISLINVYYEDLFYLYMLSIGIALGVLVWFGIVTSKARKKYFD